MLRQKSFLDEAVKEPEKGEMKNKKE